MQCLIRRLARRLLTDDCFAKLRNAHRNWVGFGAESRKPLGIVVAGGLLFALVLTLIITRVMYDLIAKNKKPEVGSVIVMLSTQEEMGN